MVPPELPVGTIFYTAQVSKALLGSKETSCIRMVGAMLCEGRCGLVLRGLSVSPGGRTGTILGSHQMRPSPRSTT